MIVVYFAGVATGFACAVMIFMGIMFDKHRAMKRDQPKSGDPL